MKSQIFEIGVPFVIIQRMSRLALLRFYRRIRLPTEKVARQDLYFQRCAPLAVWPDLRYRSGWNAADAP